MKRRLRDDRDWGDGDDEHVDGYGLGPRKRRRNWGGALLGLLGVLVALLAAAIAATSTVLARQEDDAFCVGCHTAPHITYRSRAEAALGGAYALDLSSYHYQQIRGTGGTIRCIDCHRGDSSTGDRAATLRLSADMALVWLAGAMDERIEKTTITATVAITRDGARVTLPPPMLRQPALSNDGCAGCHKQTLLTAGIDNHTHNMLPAAYKLWTAGNRLLAPAGAKDPQALLARGLTPYATAIQCASCHTGHRALETEVYLDRAQVAQRCEQCHMETRPR
jgi:hypothetical protein